MVMFCFDHKGQIVRYDLIETNEQVDAMRYVRQDDIVLELGARFGGVSIITNKILENKKNHVVVEPDCRVWNALEDNKIRNHCQFQIVKGAISNQKLKLHDTGAYDGFATHTSISEDGDVPIYSLKDYPYEFNVLIADCEGFLGTFYQENKELFSQLRLILFEKDGIKDVIETNYDSFIKELLELGFKQIKGGPHYVFLKD